MFSSSRHSRNGYESFCRSNYAFSHWLISKLDNWVKIKKRFFRIEFCRVMSEAGRTYTLVHCPYNFVFMSSLIGLKINQLLKFGSWVATRMDKTGWGRTSVQSAESQTGSLQFHLLQASRNGCASQALATKSCPKILVWSIDMLWLKTPNLKHTGLFKETYVSKITLYSNTEKRLQNWKNYYIMFDSKPQKTWQK